MHSSKLLCIWVTGERPASRAGGRIALALMILLLLASNVCRAEDTNPAIFETPAFDGDENVNRLFGPLTLQEKLKEFSHVVDIFRNFYAPLHRKRKTKGVHFDRLVKQTRELIRKDHKAGGNTQGYFDILSDFVAQFKDVHSSFYRPDTRNVSLGFVTTRVVEQRGSRVIERAVIGRINRRILPEAEYPIYVGDEIISIEGKSPRVLADELSSKINWSAPDAARDIIFRFLSFRQGFSFNIDQLLEKDSVAVVVRDRDGVRHKLHLRWSGIDLQRRPHFFGPSSSLSRREVSSIAEEEELGDEEYEIQETEFEERLSRLPGFIRSIKSAEEVSLDELPNWGEAEVDFDPKEIEIAKRMHLKHAIRVWELTLVGIEEPIRIGLIPLKTFMLTDDADYEHAFRLYRRIVTYMEAETDALLVDMMGNGGGRIDFMKNLLRLFADKTMDLGTLRLPLTRAWYVYLRQLQAEVKPGSTDAARIASLLRRFEAAKAAGETHLSEAEVFGSRDVMPIVEEDYCSYTKPLFLLVNSHCASCGEIFPGVLQANKRATLIGTTTAGAGGNVVEHGPLPYSVSSVGITESLFVLSNGRYIEDRGVRPDLEVRVTQDDYRYGYAVADGIQAKIVGFIANQLLGKVVKPRLEAQLVSCQAQLEQIGKVLPQ